MANGVAPVCYIVRGQLWPEPIRKPLAPIRRATDLNSAISAINQIADNLDKVANADFREVTRNTQRVRIHNAENYNQWVEVERITRIIFENEVTGATFEWTYKPHHKVGVSIDGLSPSAVHRHPRDSPRAGEGAPDEGGGRIPPYGEDIINRIVDVNFGGAGDGGLFVSGDHCCFFRYANVNGATDEQDWHGLGSLDFGDGGVIESGSYAVVNGRPTFLMGGIPDDRRSGMIMLSHDGIHWQTVYEIARVYAIIWDVNRGIFLWPDELRLHPISGRVCMGGEQHFRRCILGLEPVWRGDGVVGYDPDNDQMIFPNDLNALYDNLFIECTGFVGGVWMAGGEIIHWGWVGFRYPDFDRWRRELDGRIARPDRHDGKLQCCHHAFAVPHFGVVNHVHIHRPERSPCSDLAADHADRLARGQGSARADRHLSTV